MTDKNRLDEAIVKESCLALNRRANNLSDETLRELRFAREQALNGLVERGTKPDKVLLGGAGVVIASVAIAVMLLLKPGAESGFPHTELDIFELAVASEELDLYENIEFYQWLDHEKLITEALQS